MRATDRYAAQNRRARHDYLIEDTLEAGLVLHGTEVKSLRKGGASIANPMPTRKAASFSWSTPISLNTRPRRISTTSRRRPRKLLLHSKEVNRLLGAIKREGITVVPLAIYFNDRGRAKVELGLAHGKRKADKRASRERPGLAAKPRPANALA